MEKLHSYYKLMVVKTWQQSGPRTHANVQHFQHPWTQISKRQCKVWRLPSIRLQQADTATPFLELHKTICDKFIRHRGLEGRYWCFAAALGYLRAPGTKSMILRASQGLQIKTVMKADL
jgi:hypothetical protein